MLSASLSQLQSARTDRAEGIRAGDGWGRIRHPQQALEGRGCRRSIGGSLRRQLLVLLRSKAPRPAGRSSGPCRGSCRWRAPPPAPQPSRTDRHRHRRFAACFGEDRRHQGAAAGPVLVEQLGVDNALRRIELAIGAAHPHVAPLRVPPHIAVAATNPEVDLQAQP